MELKGGTLRVAGIVEVLVAARLLLAEDAPGCGRACPPPGDRDCWRSIEAVGLCDCRWLLALVCRWVSVVYEAGLWDSPSESGVAFLPRRCAGRGAVPCGAVCVSTLAVAAAACSTAWRTLGSFFGGI